VVRSHEVTVERPPSSTPLLAVAASVVIPLAMTAWSGGTGALPRLMFAIAFVWYGREAVSAERSRR
jgi:hypothetical protein